MTSRNQAQTSIRNGDGARDPDASGNSGNGSPITQQVGDPSSTGASGAHRAYLLLSLTSLFWSGNVVIGRYIAGYVPPITVSVIRWAGAFVILLPFAARHLARDWPVIRKHAGLLTLLALTGFSAYNTMAYYGLHFTTAINGLLLQSVAPLFVALWSFVLFRDRLSVRQSAGICLSLAGVVVIVCHGSLEILLAVAFNRGDLWFVVALLIYAFYVAMLRVRPAMHPLSFLAVGMAAARCCWRPPWHWRSRSGRESFSIISALLACSIFASSPPCSAICVSTAALN